MLIIWVYWLSRSLNNTNMLIVRAHWYSTSRRARGMGAQTAPLSRRGAHYLRFLFFGGGLFAIFQIWRWIILLFCLCRTSRIPPQLVSVSHPLRDFHCAVALPSRIARRSIDSVWTLIFSLVFSCLFILAGKLNSRIEPRLIRLPRYRR